MTTLPGTPNPEAPNPQQPIVQKVRLRYAKRGRLRFTSHRDFSRAFERAVRRAGTPIGFSSGYSPHPKISYANASPTGAATEAEYLEIGLTRVCDHAEVRAALDDALPPGIDIIDSVVAGQGSLADRLEASEWEISLTGVDPAEVAAAVEAFNAAESVEVQRMTKKGMRTFDSRAAVLRMSSSSVGNDVDNCAILTMVVRHGTPSVRPDDVLAGLRASGGLVLSESPLLMRLAQGPLDPTTGTVGDPFALDRDTSEQSDGDRGGV